MVDALRLTKSLKAEIYSLYKTVPLDRPQQFGKFIDKVYGQVQDNSNDTKTILGTTKSARPEIIYAFDIPLTKQLSGLKSDFEFSYLHKLLRL
eukprot:CAMPEP_0116880694 /NCGR_PEP_ID=MMETSP0463-20121206/12629_1 /TAXON_ID=181622 /ORGANISM="Strombidinopsis sp, Strain SopsisLIS2011" /LENGTH=92 /DNA_ID=CAMNT_0004531541 /DNA_START=344 /DNA_END=622 /DNA_ORIENTATION=-